MTMDDKFIYILNDDNYITPSVDYTYWLKSLNTASFNQPIIIYGLFRL